MEEKLRTAVVAILDEMLGYYQQSDGTFRYEIYADYRDEMDSKTASEILLSPDPMVTFWEQLMEWYEDYEWRLRSDLKQELKQTLTSAEGVFPEVFFVSARRSNVFNFSKVASIIRPFLFLRNTPRFVPI